MSRDRVVGPGLSHQRQLFPVESAGHVAAKLLPRVAAIRAAIEVLRSEIDCVVIVRRDHDRNAPVVSQIHFAELRLRLNALLLTRLHIVANDSAVLRFGIDGIRVGGIDSGIESVAANGDVPVAVSYSLSIARLARAGPAVVVLKPAIHVVKGLTVVEVDRVILRDRKIRDEVHRLTAIVRDVDAAVVADDEVIRIRGIDPHRVIVHVRGLTDCVIRHPAVFGNEKRLAELVETIWVPWIHPDLPHVPGELGIRALLRPARTVVVRAIHLGRIRLERRVNSARLRWRNRESDTTDVTIRKAFGHAPPRISAVSGLVDAALRSATDETVRFSLTLKCGGIHDRRIGRIHDDISHACMRADRQHCFPRFPTVDGLVESALTAARPERTLRGDEHDVRVRRVHHDAPDML